MSQRYPPTMDQTFITIHNLTPDANILFASDSISDILGFLPQEVQSKSCFDFFHPQEVPFARSVHNRGVLLDKAASLHYARILSVDGRWISCECCFTVVHDVLVACTSIYRRTLKSERRAIEAPQIRRLFSCSPRDPRYHMLEHLSPKFRMPTMEREPRAALILNRFTRSLSIMFSTNAVAVILGLAPDDLREQSFYDCIQEDCLEEAQRCLESAKANDSIAYLRFWSKDPRRPEDIPQRGQDDRSLGVNGAPLPSGPAESQSADTILPGSRAGSGRRMDLDDDGDDSGPSAPQRNGDLEAATRVKRSSSEPPNRRLGSIPSANVGSTRDGSPAQANDDDNSEAGQQSGHPVAPVEIEAVVSCTSDGLVVVVRRARPPVPGVRPPPPPVPAGGLFAAPWARNPVHPGRDHALPQGNRQGPYDAAVDSVREPRGPPAESLMRSIRDVAVFAWALVGINENIASYGNGAPQDEAVPPDWVPPPNGYPVYPARGKAEDGPADNTQPCWMGCRCKVDPNASTSSYNDWRAPLTRQQSSLNTTTSGSSSSSGGSGSSSGSGSRSRRHKPERGIRRDHHVPSGGSSRMDEEQSDEQLSRPELRSRASTSSLPRTGSQWWTDQQGRPRRGTHRRDGGREWPYPGL